MAKPVVTCLDMEGVLVPEIWISVAEKMGIPELQVTTRDIPDYDELMKRRLTILKQHQVGLPDIQRIVDGLAPLDGAADFLGWLRERCQVVVLSDTYYEFVWPLMRQLRFPTLFCHTLEVDEKGIITNYYLRQRDQKRHAVKALKGLEFRVLAGGDSYNDISMLTEADTGIFFRPPDSIRTEYPQFPVTQTYAEFQEQLCLAGNLRP